MVAIINDRDNARVQAPVSINHKAVDKITKLLAKANDKACPKAERQACLTAAQKIADKNNIDLATMGVRAAELADELVVKDFEFEDDLAVMESVLFCKLMTVLRCRATLDPDADGTVVVVVGYLSDIEAAEERYLALSDQMARSAAGRAGRTTNGWMGGWQAGAIDALTTYEAEAAAALDPEVTEVLAERAAAVQAGFGKMFPEPVAPAEPRVSPAWAGGYEAGRKADVAGKAPEPRRQAALAG